MPNHCMNTLRVWGDPKEVARFVGAIPAKDDTTEFSILENLVPRPDDIGEGWYDWSLDNWGTKWGDYEGTFTAEDENEVSMSFTTAWSPCEAGLDKVAKQFPTLKFMLEYEESGMCFCGVVGWSDGKRVAESYTSDYSSEDFAKGDPNADDYLENLMDGVMRLVDAHREIVEKQLG